MKRSGLVLSLVLLSVFTFVANAQHRHATESHRTLFAQNIPAFKNVANLGQLPTSGFSVIALPMKIKNGSGGPLRIITVLGKHK